MSPALIDGSVTAGTDILCFVLPAMETYQQHPREIIYAAKPSKITNPPSHPATTKFQKDH